MKFSLKSEQFWMLSQDAEELIELRLKDWILSELDLSSNLLVSGHLLPKSCLLMLNALL